MTNSSAYDEAQADLETIKRAWDTISKVIHAAVAEINDTNRPDAKAIADCIASMADGYSDLFYDVERRALSTQEEISYHEGQQEARDLDVIHRSYIGQP